MSGGTGSGELSLCPERDSGRLRTQSREEMSRGFLCREGLGNMGAARARSRWHRGPRNGLTGRGMLISMVLRGRPRTHSPFPGSSGGSFAHTAGCLGALGMRRLGQRGAGRQQGGMETWPRPRAELGVKRDWTGSLCRRSEISGRALGFLQHRTWGFE